MRILVGGTRTFNNFRLLERKLNRITKGKKKVTVITGGQGGQDEKGAIIGADAMAEWWAYLHHHTVEVYPADWKKYGPSAGPRRNSEMVEKANVDRAVFFWDGHSSGTKDCIDKARKAGLRVKIIRYVADKRSQTQQGFGL